MLWKFAIFMASCVAGLLSLAACKVGLENSDDILPKAIVGLFCIDIVMGNPVDAFELAIFALSEFLFFVVVFYIIYGIMSLLKVAGEDTADRRRKAFWINFALSILLTIGVYF